VLAARVAAATLGFPGDALCLLVMEPRVEEAPGAPFNRCPRGSDHYPFVRAGIADTFHFPFQVCFEGCRGTSLPPAVREEFV
jgi:hypothetical protein